jgi:hypothetical protein
VTCGAASFVVLESVMSTRRQLHHQFSALASGSRPRRTVRLRLTLVYSGLFVLCGAALLAITYLLVRHFSGHESLARYGPVSSSRPARRAGPLPKLPPLAQLQARAQHDLARQHATICISCWCGQGRRWRRWRWRRSRSAGWWPGAC